MAEQQATPVWAQTIIDAHLAVAPADAVSHSEKLSSERYFVWEEDGANDLGGDDSHAEHAVTGATDLYSKLEFDPWAGAIGESFDRRGVSWELVTADYEEETGFYHWSYDWEVC